MSRMREVHVEAVGEPRSGVSLLAEGSLRTV
jgi:hypothetical protein